MGLSIQWTKHLKDPSHRDRFIQALQASGIALARLKDILKERARDMDSTAFKLSDFEDPSWSHKQAYRNGYLAALKEVQDLVDFSTKE